ncbi:MAG TPA: alpha/beta hydrolase [Candidatus Limnocylindrales bacterium]|nr:alpha/beta hydrolase [Candidatus Limnocylindrales bacterium]
MTAPKTHTLDAPGATITYDVREAETSDVPVLLLIGSPMGADGFATLAGYFPDRTVVTYDPRSAGRSRRTDGARETTPDEHADDLHRVIGAVGGGPVDIFATSGGAVNALVLVTKHPEVVRTLVAHEPPAAQVLPDREQALAATENIRDTYQESGLGPAMAKFITLVMLKGPIPAGFGQRPVDPSAFGLPTQDDGARDDPLVGQNIITCTHHQHDFDAVRAASTRVVVAVGEESEGEMAYRAGKIVAERLGSAAVIFPSHHGGFMGPESGPMQGKPEAFAAKLREVL